METQGIAENVQINTNAYRLISYSLVAAMIVCAVSTIVSLIIELQPTWQPTYLIWFCLIVAIDRLYSYRISRNWMFLSRPWLVIFGTHLIVIVALAKGIVGLSHGWAFFLKDMQGWSSDFPRSFIDYETGFALVLASLTWVICGSFANMLEEIGPDQALMARLDLVRREAVSIRQRLISLFFSVGAFLVLLTMIARVSQRANFVLYTYNPTLQIPVLGMGGASTLLYFMLGLALLSQTQFISLHVRWNIQKIPVTSKLARQWAGYSLLFLALIAFAVSLVPTNYSMQPLAIAGYVINLLLYLVFYMGQLIFTAFMNIGSLIFGKAASSPPPVFNEPQTKLLPPNDIITAGGGPNWWEIIRVTIFWLIFLSILLVSIRQYLRQNKEIFAKLRSLPGWRFFTQLWGWLQNLLTQTKTSLQLAAASVRERVWGVSTGKNTGSGFINLRKLGPRQKVYFFYLAFIRRAGEKGLPRSSHQTPDEFAATLQHTLPDTAEDIHALTEAFISARYSRQPVELAQAQSAENLWGRIRKTLRGKQ